MGTNRRVMVGLPMGELPVVVERVSAGPVVADTFAGRIHLEWDGGAPVTPLGQLPFFIEYVKQGELFDGVVIGCTGYSQKIFRRFAGLKFFSGEHCCR